MTSVPRKRIVALILATSIAAVTLPAQAVHAQPAPAARTAQTASLQGPRSVQQGDKTTFTATFGAQHRNRLAVLEESTKKGFVPVSVARVGAAGKVTFTTTLPMTGSHSLRVRVLKGRQTAAFSSDLAVVVRARQLTAGQEKEQAREAALARVAIKHHMPALGGAPARAPQSRGTVRAKNAATPLPPITAWTDTVSVETQTAGAATTSVNQTLAGLASADRSAARRSAEHATHAAESMEESVAVEVFDKVSEDVTEVGSIAAESIIDFGVEKLLDLIFPSAAELTLEAVQELSADMEADFELVGEQLDAIEGDLGDLSTQVSQISAQVTSANASAAAANCTAMMTQANAYVTQIQGNYSNYQDTLNSQWVLTNMPIGGDADAVMRVMGNQVFGSGSGTPSFLQGLNRTQNATTNLAHQLTGIGLPAGSSLIDACSSAVAASLAAQSGTFNTNGFTTPVGVVDENYFDEMQAITAYYASWADVGQFLSTVGSQWAIITLDPTPPTSKQAAAKVCGGVAPDPKASPGAAITCPELAALIADTNAALNAAWDKTGASWNQVSGGVLASDAAVRPTSDYIVPSSSVWSRDPGASFGAVGSGSAVDTANYPSGGLTWSELNLKPATAAQWNKLLQLINQPAYAGAVVGSIDACGSRNLAQPGAVLRACTAAQSMGQLITSAGLSFNGTVPNKIIFTGESSTWDDTQGPAQYVLQSGVNGLYPGYDQGIQSWAVLNYWKVNSFIDPALTGNNGYSVVIHDPAADERTLDMNDLYAWGNGSSISINNAGEGASLITTPTMFGSCQSNWANTGTHLETPAGASRLWAQWVGLANGTQWSVTNDWGNACANSHFSNNGLAGHVNVTNDNGEYGSVNFNSYNSNSKLPAWQPATVPGVIASGPYLPALGGSGGSSVTQYGGPSNVAFAVPTTSPLFATTLSEAATTGIQWPSMDLTPAGGNCPTTGTYAGATSFSQGSSNNAGVTNTCNYLWAMYKANLLGDRTGNLDLTAHDQKTKFPTGEQAFITLSNELSSATTATVLLASLPGVTLTGSPVAANGSAGSVTGCASVTPTDGAANEMQCTVSIPANSAVQVSIPVGYASGVTSGKIGATVVDMNGANGTPRSFSGSMFTVYDVAASTGSVPGTPTNLAVKQSTTGTNAIVAAWTAPDSDPAVSSYTLKMVDPNGNPTTQTITPDQLAVVGNSDGVGGVTNAAGGDNSDMQVTTTLPLPSTVTGMWGFELTAINANGSSAVAEAQTFLGEAVPLAVQHLKATEMPNGTITLTWASQDANPVVTGYQVAWQQPDGQWFDPVTVTGTSFSLPQDAPGMSAKQLSVGTWAFRVRAQNSLGTGAAATTQVSLLGTAPSPVANLDADISGDGMISVKWNGADAVPAPTTYNLAIYGPDAAGAALLTQDFPVTGVNSMVNIPNFFQIGNDTKPGMYTAVVAATNSIGRGETAQSSLYISQATINHSTAGRIGEQILGSMPTSFQALAASQCQAGLWQSGYLVFGTCDPTKLVFTPAPGLPPLTNPTPLPTAQTGVG